VSPVIEEAAKLLLNHETKSMRYCKPPTATALLGAWMEPESCIWSRRQLLISQFPNVKLCHFGKTKLDSTTANYSILGR